MGAAVATVRVYLGLLLLLLLPLLVCVLCAQVCVCFCVGSVCLWVKGPASAQTPDLTPATTACHLCENRRMETPSPCPAASAAP